MQPDAESRTECRTPGLARQSRPVTRVVRGRILATLGLAILLVIVTAVRRGPDDRAGLHRDLFWAEKLTWRQCADFVIAGDSRACRDVAPPALSARLPYRRILNFAFDSSGYSEAYLHAIENVLDGAARPTAIALAITPYSLTEAAVRENEFEYRRRWMPFQSRAGLYARQSLRFLRPMRIDDLPAQLLGRGDDAAQMTDADHEYRDDGWLAMARRGGDTTMYVSQYRAAFLDNSASAEVIDTLLTHVRRWRAAGINVYAFRPPVAEPILDIERDCSGFDEAAFIAALRRAGGVWIPMPPTGFLTYDGSHLGRDEAARFSTALAAAVSRRSTSADRLTKVLDPR